MKAVTENNQKTKKTQIRLGTDGYTERRGTVRGGKKGRGGTEWRPKREEKSKQRWEKCRAHFVTFLDAPLIDGKFSVDVEPV